MRSLKILALAAGSLLAVACAMEGDRPTSAAAMADGEASLAAAIRDRVAGAPERCINLALLRGDRILAGDAILFGGAGGSRLYVNRPGSRGCPLRDGLALVTRTPGSQLCRGEIVEIVDPVTGVTQGACTLSDFVPYERR